MIKLKSQKFFPSKLKLNENGGTEAVALSSGMLPFIKPLSNIRIHSVSVDQIEVGDLVSHVFGGYARTSRVVRIIHVAEKATFILKEDNKLSLVTVSPKEMIGIVTLPQKISKFQRKLIALLSYWPAVPFIWMTSWLPKGKSQALRTASFVQPLSLYGRFVNSRMVLKPRTQKNVTIRTFHESDIPSLVRLWNLCFPNRPTDEFHFTQKICGSPWFAREGCFLALKDFRIVGFIFASDRQGSLPRLGFIECLAVNPDERRQGIGSLLLDQAVGYLRKKGSRSCRTGNFSVSCDEVGWVVPDSAVNFFVAKGFEVAEFARELFIHEFDSEIASRLVKNVEDQSFNIRRATEADRHAFEETIQKREKSWRNVSVGNLENVILATRNGKINGCVQTICQNQASSYDQLEWIWDAGIDQKRGSIGFLYVDPEFRAFGLGAALVAEALDDLSKRRGCQEIWGFTSSPALIARYQRWGVTSQAGVTVMSRDL